MEKIKNLKFKNIFTNSVFVVCNMLKIRISYLLENDNAEPRKIEQEIYVSRKSKNQKDNIELISQLQESVEENNKFINAYGNIKRNIFNIYQAYNINSTGIIKFFNWFEENFLTDENKLRIKMG